jgi:hypothetical protein
MKEHKHAEVLRAIADGKEVEYRVHKEDIWRLPVDFNPIAQQHLEWRIKPEPKPPIVVELHVRYSDLIASPIVQKSLPNNVRFTFDPDTKLPIKVELI